MKDLESTIKESLGVNPSISVAAVGTACITQFLKHLIPLPGEHVDIKGFDGRVLRVMWQHDCDSLPKKEEFTIKIDGATALRMIRQALGESSHTGGCGHAPASAWDRLGDNRKPWRHPWMPRKRPDAPKSTQP